MPSRLAHFPLDQRTAAVKADGFVFIYFPRIIDADLAACPLSNIAARLYDAYIDAPHSTINALEGAVHAFRLSNPESFDDYLWNDPKWNHDGWPNEEIVAFLTSMPNR